MTLLGSTGDPPLRQAPERQLVNVEPRKDACGRARRSRLESTSWTSGVGRARRDGLDVPADTRPARDGVRRRRLARDGVRPLALPVRPALAGPVRRLPRAIRPPNSLNLLAYRRAAGPRRRRALPALPGSGAAILRDRFPGTVTRTSSYLRLQWETLERGPRTDPSASSWKSPEDLVRGVSASRAAARAGRPGLCVAHGRAPAAPDEDLGLRFGGGVLGRERAGLGDRRRSRHPLRRPRARGGIAEAAIFAAARDASGNLYLATGDTGKILRVGPTGKVEAAGSLREKEVTALAVAPDGTLYAAGAPGGKVYRLDRAGKPSLHYETKAQYVWSLVFAGGSLWAGTGLPGEIHRISGPLRGERVHAASDAHVSRPPAQGRIWRGRRLRPPLRVEPAGRDTIYDLEIVDPRDPGGTTESSGPAASPGLPAVCEPSGPMGWSGRGRAGDASRVDDRSNDKRCDRERLRRVWQRHRGRAALAALAELLLRGGSPRARSVRARLARLRPPPVARASSLPATVPNGGSPLGTGPGRWSARWTESISLALGGSDRHHTRPALSTGGGRARRKSVSREGTRAARALRAFRCLG